jgi:hypothetical protein
MLYGFHTEVLGIIRSDTNIELSFHLSEELSYHQHTTLNTIVCTMQIQGNPGIAITWKRMGMVYN